MMLHVMDAATGLVLAQKPIPDKENEIKSIPELLSYLDIQESTITADALNTQTRVMEQIISQGGHFVMMVKKNQPASYEEIIEQFDEMKEERKRMAEDPAGKSRYPQFMEKI